VEQSDARLDRSARHSAAAADAPAWPKAAPLRSAAHARAAEALDESQATSLEQLLHEINAGRTELQSQAWLWRYGAWHVVRCAYSRCWQCPRQGAQASVRRSACEAQCALHANASHAGGRPADVCRIVEFCLFVCLQLKSLREQLHIADGSLGLQRQQHDEFVSAYDVRCYAWLH
jgi:hypothetical protein